MQRLGQSFNGSQAYAQSGKRTRPAGYGEGFQVFFGASVFLQQRGNFRDELRRKSSASQRHDLQHLDLVSGRPARQCDAALLSGSVDREDKVGHL